MDEDLKNEKETSRMYYSQIGAIFSPALQKNVNFSSEGFNHLIYKNAKRVREDSSQLLRFKLLPLAAKLIGLSTTYQEFEETGDTQYWGIIAIINNRKIKVVLKKAASGAICFWSIIPAWKTNKYRDIRFFTTMSGDPEQD